MNKTIKRDYIKHRERIKRKYKIGGLNGWLDYEILEFALAYAIPRKDTKPIAKELLSRFKTINGVLDADRRKLEEVSGISEHTVLFLNFLKDIAIIYLEKGLYRENLCMVYIFTYLSA